MDLVLKLNEQTVGRDKIIRILQYGSRACWYYSQNNSNKRYTVDVLRSLEYTFSSFRKLLRLGRFLDSLYLAMRTMKCPNITLRIMLTLSKLSNSLYLLADHIIWVGRVGIARVDVEKWSKIANRYWLITIVINLVRDVYEIVKMLKNQKSHVPWKIPSSCGNSWRKKSEFLFPLKNRYDILFDSIRNACDLFIPLTALGYTKFNPGMIGIFGILSSIIGLITIIEPSYKLTPS